MCITSSVISAEHSSPSSEANDFFNDEECFLFTDFPFILLFVGDRDLGVGRESYLFIVKKSTMQPNDSSLEINLEKSIRFSCGTGNQCTVLDPIHFVLL